MNRIYSSWDQSILGTEGFIKLVYLNHGEATFPCRVWGIWQACDTLPGRVGLSHPSPGYLFGRGVWR
jgi:hypothetical protein